MKNGPRFKIDVPLQTSNTKIISKFRRNSQILAIIGDESWRLRLGNLL